MLDLIKTTQIELILTYDQDARSTVSKVKELKCVIAEDNIVVNRMDQWMMDDLDFKSFSTVFQSYDQDDGRLIMKGCVQWSSV